MLEHTTPYLQHHICGVKLKISAVLSSGKASDVAREAFSFHFSDKNSITFQDYYIATITNRQHFLSSKDFFREFKKMYSLQGIDGAYLQRLESEKNVLLSQLDANNLTDLYIDHFAYASIQHGTAVRTKNLGSFFAKFVHTFRPEEYCALDNPIKDYLGLSREGFYLSFLLVSAAYKSWLDENIPIVTQIREQLDSTKTGERYSSHMTDLKLLDLIFWLKANNSDLLSNL